MKVSLDEKTWHDPRFVHACRLLGWQEQTVLGALVMLQCRVYKIDVELSRQPLEILTGLGKHAARFVDVLLECGLLFESPSGALTIDGAQRAKLLRKARAEAGRRGGAHKKAKPMPPAAPKKRKKSDTDDTILKLKCGAAWGAYASAYMQRWGSPPVRNGKVNAQVKRLVQNIGDDTPALLWFFVLKHDSEYYVRRTHQIGDCLKDAESLVTQMRRGAPVTQHQAKRAAHENTVREQLAGVRSGSLLR